MKIIEELIDRIVAPEKEIRGYITIGYSSNVFF